VAILNLGNTAACDTVRIVRHRLPAFLERAEQAEAPLARELASDRKRLRRACAQVFPGWRDLQTYAVALLVAVASVRIARSLVAPPMATDALTYHLVRASRFVQTGTFAIEPTPDAGGYYAYYPPLGDVFWSWWLLAAHSDTWIGLGQACLLFALGLATFTAAEQLGAPRRIAIWAALALLATPAVLSWSSAAYADTFVLVGFAAGVAWCPRAIRTAAPIALALPIVGFALAAGAKTTGLVPLAAGTALMLGVLLVRGRQRGMGALAIGLPLLVVLPGLAIGLVDHGNPLYPFGLHAGPWTLSGNEENELLHRGALFPAHMVAFDPSVFLRRLFWPNFDPRVQHLNLGPVTPVLALLGCSGLIWLREGSARALTGALLVLVGLAFVAKLAGPDTLTLRTSSAPAIGRFLTMPLLVIVLAASRAPAHLAVPVFALQIVCGSALGFPRGLGTVDLLALRWSSPGLLLALCLVLLSWRLRRAWGIAAAVAVLLGTRPRRAATRAGALLRGLARG